MRKPGLTVAAAIAAAALGAARLEGAVYTHGDPTDAEQLLLELINKARSNPQAEANRLGIGLNDGIPSGQTIQPTFKQPLALNAELIAAARSHSDWMLATDVFDHTGAGGSNPDDRMKAAGYKFTGGWAWGENIGWSGTIGTPALNDLTRSIHDGLFRSPPHRVNLMNDGFDDVGLGVREGKFYNAGRDYNAVMVTEGFTRSDFTPGPVLVGVAYRDLNKNGAYDPGEGVGDVTVQVSGSQDSALSSRSGGYRLPYSGSGSVAVTFRHATYGSSTLTATRTGKNVKLDWMVSDAPQPKTLLLSGVQKLANGNFQFQIGGTYQGAIWIERTADFQAWDRVSLSKNSDVVTYSESTASRPWAAYRVRSNP